MRFPAGYVALIGWSHLGQLVSFPAVAGNGYMAFGAYRHEYQGKGAIVFVA